MTGPTQRFAWGLSPSVPIHCQNIAISAIAPSLCASIPLRCWPFTAFWHLVPISEQPCQEKTASSLLTR